MSEQHTPQPWPESVMPTPGQLADWLVIATREERVDLASRMIESADTAHRCFIQNHDGLAAEVRIARARSARYRKAWLSARRRIHPQNFLRGWRRLAEEEDARTPRGTTGGEG